MMFLRASHIFAGVAACCLAGVSSALTIDLDYSFDQFFGSNSTAQAALEAAADDLSDLITTSLDATVDTIQGVSGSTTASFNFQFNYTHPGNGLLLQRNPAIATTDTVKVYVAGQTFGGTTLGQGGPGSGSVVVGLSGFTSEYQAAWDLGHADAQLNARRGAGPVIGNLSGSLNTATNSYPYDIDLGLSLGSVSFDDDANWHFDHTTAVAPGRFDLYSVALHELLHVLGIGTAKSFSDLVVGTNWLGSNVSALINDGVGVINPSGDHIAEGIVSQSILDGAAQEAAMDPTIAPGTRKNLTELDVAFLRDIGWTVVVPEPSLAGMLVIGISILQVAGRRRRLV